jgi:hypothetical protein
MNAIITNPVRFISPSWGGKTTLRLQGFIFFPEDGKTAAQIQGFVSFSNPGEKKQSRFWDVK